MKETETEADREAIEAMDGRPIDDMAEVGEQEEPDEPEAQLTLPGTVGKGLSNSVGGKRPTSSEFSMRSVSLPISENLQMEKDSKLWVAVEVDIDQVTVKNHKKGRDITSVVRTHTATPLSVIVLDGPPDSE